MILDHAVARDSGEVLRNELQDVRHHSDVDVEAAQRLLRFRGLQGRKLE